MAKNSIKAADEKSPDVFKMIADTINDELNIIRRMLNALIQKLTTRN